MPQRTYLVFGDIEGKLDTLRVECTKCPRKGRYRVRKLIEKYGRKANIMKWKEQLNGDCPKRQAPSITAPEASLPPSVGATASATSGQTPTHVGKTPRRRGTGSTGSPPSDRTEPRRKGHKCA